MNHVFAPIFFAETHILTTITYFTTDGMHVCQKNLAIFAYKIPPIEKIMILPQDTLKAVKNASKKASEENRKPRILFVCLGNICRSPAADGLMQALLTGKGERWKIDSAGTGRYHIGSLPDHRMRVHARRRGYDLTHRARQVRQSDFDDFDLIVAMDAANERDLRQLAPTDEAESKIVPMIDFVDLSTRYDHIPDPYYEGSEGFELVLDLLENGVSNLYESLR